MNTCHGRWQTKHGYLYGQVGVVLRVRKTQNERGIVSEEGDTFSLEYEHDFQRHIISKLINGCYISEMQLIRVTPTFLTALSNSLSTVRPRSRQHKDLDTSQPWAALMSDHTIVPELQIQDRAPAESKPEAHGLESGESSPKVIAVEIKPKWGFLPVSPVINPAHSVKYTTCRYCMHQHWKGRKYEDHLQSSFCPLDLYSKDTERIKTSLKSLLRSPQNNLKLFVDGMPVMLGQGQSIDKSFSVLESFFRRIVGEPEAPSFAGVDHLVDLLTTIIVSDSLLQMLKYHQQNLDQYDIEGIFPWYDKLEPDTKLHDPSIAEWNEILQTYLRRMSSPDADVPPDWAECSPTEQLHYIYEFVLSATLKDCSVIITLWPEAEKDRYESIHHDPGEGEGKIQLSGSTHLLRYKIRIVDIDPKCMRKIPSYFALDQNIVRYCDSVLLHVIISHFTEIVS
ncbi:inositol-pentakisphosphate 2-kinase [Spizellomyces sp. 'palustris']|nr:inositol-pentakisphosphate 2-kinase [Spizellomyces sp. 'palustris']